MVLHSAAQLRVNICTGALCGAMVLYMAVNIRSGAHLPVNTAVPYHSELILFGCRTGSK